MKNFTSAMTKHHRLNANKNPNIQKRFLLHNFFYHKFLYQKENEYLKKMLEK